MKIDWCNVIPVSHQHCDVEVPQTGILIDHELLHLGYLEAAELGLGGLNAEQLPAYFVVDLTKPCPHILHREHVTVVTSKAFNGLSQHVPDNVTIVVFQFSWLLFLPDY